MVIGMLGSRKFVLLVLAVALCGCAARNNVQPAFASGDSGIAGQLVTTSTSSNGTVQVAGAARGTVNVTTADERQQVATVDTDSGGNFQIGLRPGRYFVYTQPTEGMLYGRKVAVEPRQMTHMELQLPPWWTLGP
jgi:hypothetical protein